MLIQILIATIACLHIYFLLLEMFLWDKPLGLKTFRQSIKKAQDSKSLAMNMGLYNGFLAAGLIWSLYLADAGKNISIFFLTCVLIAGIFGSLTVAKKVFFIQGLPAALALMLLLVT